MYFWYCICIFVFGIFTQKKLKKIPKKKTEKYECNCSKIQNTKKIRIDNFKNTKYKKKNTSQKNQKYKIQRKDKFQNKPESQPRVHWKSGNKLQKKYKTNHLYFPNPAVLILYFWVVFFVFLNIGRRPFCCHRGLLKHCASHNGSSQTFTFVSFQKSTLPILQVFPAQRPRTTAKTLNEHKH